MSLVALLLAAACRQPDGSRNAAAPTPPTDSAVRNPSVVVVVHSWTGRTGIVGAEIAAMLGSRLVRFSNPPFPDGTQDGRTLEQTVADLGDLSSVRDLYLGFPVWDEQPSAPMRALVDHLTLTGIRVIPFYTFLHFIRPETLGTLRASLHDRGARQVERPMAFQLPMTTSAEEILELTRRAVLQRLELWAAAEGDAANGCQAGRCAIPGGQVWIGDTAPDAPPGAPAPRLYSVAPFTIDEGEVTVAVYQRCVAAGACPPPDTHDAFCSTLVKDDDTLPQPCVSLEAAAVYCKWSGGRLPTEAQWMRAARGQSTDRFPWGSSFEDQGPLRGNFGEKPSTGFPNYAPVPETAVWPADGFPGLAPPCSFPAGRSPFGVCDSAGNLSEWVLPDASGTPIVLGSSWLDGAVSTLHLGRRYVLPVLPPAMAHGGSSCLIGFRCVR